LLSEALLSWKHSKRLFKTSKSFCIHKVMVIGSFTVGTDNSFYSPKNHVVECFHFKSLKLKGCNCSGKFYYVENTVNNFWVSESFCIPKVMVTESFTVVRDNVFYLPKHHVVQWFHFIESKILELLRKVLLCCKTVNDFFQTSKSFVFIKVWSLKVWQ